VVIVQTDVTVQRMASPAVWQDQATGQWVMLGVDVVSAQVLNRAAASAPEGPWSAFSPVTVTGAWPAGRLPWHLDARMVGDKVLALVVDGASAGGNVYLSDINNY